ncbi:hypothetical protein JQS43_05055 [Natronosporangium hydrolyticum]|uniref:Uncharacterized protein n=1 Tax=Natronosporangium hydrolyticum TaxID=2811111 RepID=A0A895YJL3_9ACTN|nr:hypothetical protein [Natronosporangium hydrolyticum]QSB15709.1 hypothetical protein JQS43_05055 [Natronosporangium hydrolyticum]
MIIGRRFNGPPDSGNGGYTAGLIAAEVPVEAGMVPQVTLRRPPPLETELRLRPGTPTLAVLAGDDLIAEATPVAPADPTTAPAPVSWDDAQAAADAYPGFAHHPFPTCYVCGPRRPEHDGLNIFPGRLADGRTAATWRVPPAGVDPVTVWAALDCPGGWAVLSPARPYVLGRIAAQITRLPTPGEQCVVTGATREQVGRKAQVRTALYGAGPGQPLLAHAAATWIAL